MSCESRNCGVCGEPLPAKQGRGRLRMYCGKTCYRKGCSRKKRLKQCERCGESFTTSRTATVTCSPSCAQQLRGDRDAKRYTCSQCCKSFRPKASNRKTYCSRECSFKAQRTAKLLRLAVIQEKPSHQLKPCVVCKKVAAMTASQKYCSADCVRQRGREQARRGYTPKNVTRSECVVCAGVMPLRPGRKYCSKACHKKAELRTRGYSEADRFRKRQIKRRKFQPHDIFARDGWKCQLCHRSVDPQLRFPHPLCATLDHIVPVSKGGDDVPENVQLVHNACNNRKSNTGAAQMLLFG